VVARLPPISCKIAAGIASDMCVRRSLLPSTHYHRTGNAHRMWENKATQENVKILKSRAGFCRSRRWSPGFRRCRSGRLAEVQTSLQRLIEYFPRPAISPEKGLLYRCGTREPIDPSASSVIVHPENGFCPGGCGARPRRLRKSYNYRRSPNPASITIYASRTVAELRDSVFEACKSAMSLLWLRQFPIIASLNRLPIKSRNPAANCPSS